MKVQASIDLGTNTCLLLVRENPPEKILHDESQVVRLGQGVDRTGELAPEAMGRAFQCLKEYVRVAQSFGVQPSHILAVGTAQARDAKNANSFFTRIERELGIRFKVLSGDEEAAATFRGAALPGMDIQKMVVMDIGGGSTEIVSFTGGESLSLGAVRMTERYLKSDPCTDQEFWTCESAIDDLLSTRKAWRESLQAPEFVAVAGTAVTLAMLNESIPQYDRARLEGVVITKGDAHRLVEELKWRSVEERKKMVGMEPKRADVILAGALIFWRTMEVLDFNEAKISTRGLRFGVLD